MTRTAACLALMGLLVAPGAFAGDPGKPPVPIGQDPGGPAVAIIGTGIDYTRPEIAKSLARDGEGEIIAWDFVDNDNRPFAKSGGTPAADLAVQHPGKRLIVVRIDAARPVTLGQAVAFVARTPAESVLLALGPRRPADWEPFRQAMVVFKSLKVRLVCQEETPGPGAPQADGHDLIRADQLGLANVLPCQGARPDKVR